MAKDPPISPLVIDELFSSQDDAFVPSLRRVADLAALSRFADRWNRDPRPWARQQVFRYLDGPLGFKSDPPLLKRLFKFAEVAGDDELVGTFLVAFDCAVRRVRVSRYRYDWQTRSNWQEESLKLPRTRRRPMPNFSYHTLYYLRRRAWRYFRRKGFQAPALYPAAIAGALRWYRDADLERGENILDSWGLVHACFGKHDALDLGSSKVNLKPGRDLGELTPAPYFLTAWRAPEAVAILLALVGDARSRVVRVWAMGMVRRQHGRKLAGVDVGRLLPLFDHDDEEVQQFAAELFDAMDGLRGVTIETWLQLLRTRNLTALSTITAVALREGVGAALSIGQLVELACERRLPVARFGWLLLREREIDDAALPTIAGLADVRAAAVAGETASWALGQLARRYDVDLVTRFFDSLLTETREAAWAWLTPTTPAWNDPTLWSRLLESPYDDVRHRVVVALEARANLPGGKLEDLTRLWSSVLLNVHRGGRRKLTALRQISDRLRREPDAAATLLPVMTVAMRSVRTPEARAGVAAVVAALAARPALAADVGRLLPELRLVGEGASA